MKKEKLILYLKIIDDINNILKKDVDNYLNSDDEKTKRINLELLENNVLFLGQIITNFSGDIDFYSSLENLEN